MTTLSRTTEDSKCCSRNAYATAFHRATQTCSSRGVCYCCYCCRCCCMSEHVACMHAGSQPVHVGVNWPSYLLTYFNSEAQMVMPAGVSSSRYTRLLCMFCSSTVVLDPNSLRSLRLWDIVTTVVHTLRNDNAASEGEPNIERCMTARAHHPPESPPIRWAETPASTRRSRSVALVLVECRM
jgi:hypothetical protein